jgi:hypothetical protein
MFTAGQPTACRALFEATAPAHTAGEATHYTPTPLGGSRARIRHGSSGRRLTFAVAPHEQVTYRVWPDAGRCWVVHCCEPSRASINSPHAAHWMFTDCTIIMCCRAISSFRCLVGITIPTFTRRCKWQFYAVNAQSPALVWKAENYSPEIWIVDCQ